MRRWTISVDKDACVGSAMCVAIAPGRFVLVAGARFPEKWPWLPVLRAVSVALSRLKWPRMART